MVVRVSICPCVDLLTRVLWACVLLRMRLHCKLVNLDSPKYKPYLYPRVKCTPCLLSLGLATGAASSACRFLQEDWAPLKTGLLLMLFVTMTEPQMHTHARTHPTQTWAGACWNQGLSWIILLLFPLLQAHSNVSYLCGSGRLCESVTSFSWLQTGWFKILRKDIVNIFSHSICCNFFKRRYYFYIWNLKKIRVIYTVLYKMYHTFWQKKIFWCNNKVKFKYMTVFFVFLLPSPLQYSVFFDLSDTVVFCFAFLKQALFITHKY